MAPGSVVEGSQDSLCFWNSRSVQWVWRQGNRKVIRASFWFNLDMPPLGNAEMTYGILFLLLLVLASVKWELEWTYLGHLDGCR